MIFKLFVFLLPLANPHAPAHLPVYQQTYTGPNAQSLCISGAELYILKHPAPKGFTYRTSCSEIHP